MTDVKWAALPIVSNALLRLPLSCVQVWDPKPLIRKGRDRHLFLFELHLIFAKEMKDSQVCSRLI